jgi:hypothetical protein
VPLDHQVFRIADVAELPKNCTTEHMIVELKHKRSQAGRRIAESGGLGSGLCEFCDEAHAASHRCLDCCQNMCKLAVSFHRKTKGTKNHRIEELDLKVDLEAAAAAQAPAAGAAEAAVAASVCPEHNAALQFCDKHCKAILCPNCVVLGPEHRGHECVTLDVAAADSRASL